MAIRVDTLTQDLRSVVRALRQAPAFVALVVASLAIGIGVNTALFGIVREMLFPPIPYQNPDRVVLVEAYSRDL